MNHILKLCFITLAITSVAIPMTSIVKADYYVDLKVNSITYTLLPENVRMCSYNIKNVGNWQADPTFYCDVYFDIFYQNGQIGSMTRILVAHQAFIAILHAGQVSPTHYAFYTWVNPDPDHYSGRFTVWADSNQQFNDELSETDNWLSTPSFL